MDISVEELLELIGARTNSTTGYEDGIISVTSTKSYVPCLFETFQRDRNEFTGALLLSCPCPKCSPSC